MKEDNEMLEWLIPLVAVALVYYATERTKSWALRAAIFTVWMLLVGMAYGMAHVYAAQNQPADSVIWGFISLITALAPFVFILFKLPDWVRL